MKISLMAAKSEDGVIGNGPDIPWNAKGEQLLFKAITFNQWLLVGRKTFDAMGVLPNRNYAVVSRTEQVSTDDNVLFFKSIDDALLGLAERSNHVIVSGGGELYRQLIEKSETLHLSTIHQSVDGDITFPEIPDGFNLVFEQAFTSNINYTYQIWQRVE